jgi:DNA repair protein RecN (Recombination protein N)
MLTELSIENFAIIDHLHVPFSPGFTVLTGETGAGKSIIIDALQAALGARVSADVVRSDARAASVEAVFEVGEDRGETITDLLEEYGVGEDDYIVLRREINAGGRSVARLNGRAVPVSVLGALGSALVDIHGQSEHLSILRRDRQLDVLDRYGGLWSLRDSAAMAVREYAGLIRQRDELLAGQREAEQRLDLLRFQVGEIRSAQLREGEEEELLAERNLLANAEKLAQLASQAYSALADEAGSATERLGDGVAALRDIAGIDPALSALSERLDSALYELEDAAQEIRQYRDGVEYDPRRLDAIEERLDMMARLRRKYGPELEDVIDFGTRAQHELELVENVDERMAELDAEIERAEEAAATTARALSSARLAAAAEMTSAMAEALRGLGLKGTAFDVRVDRTESPSGLPFPDGKRYAFSQTGVDAVSFMVSFNPGEPLRPLELVASGGETSRFLLALKSVLAGADRTPTLIFDEVDVGVGGRRAMDVGQRMRALSREHQVVSITHMPQIAALADEHVTVMKAVRAGRTTVDVKRLEGGERVGEIAEMMSGSETDAALRSAQELLQAAQHGS